MSPVEKDRHQSFRVEPEEVGSQIFFRTKIDVTIHKRQALLGKSEADLLAAGRQRIVQNLDRHLAPVRQM
jgi:hypothetical protein